MSSSEHLKRLINAVAPYWAGEAEVFRVYWDWPGRTRATDRTWLAYQCSKEIWGSGLEALETGMFLGPARELVAAFPRIDTEIDRHEILDIAQGLAAEFAHYCAFADAYDALAGPGEPKMNPYRFQEAWPEDRALAALRLEHKHAYPGLGARAAHFTEGGYCGLFSEGMALATRPGGSHAEANALIASACAKVYDDEFGHMLRGIANLEAQHLDAGAWATLERISVEQSKARILMRDSQFSHPLEPEHLAAALAGACAPVAFDYERAGLAHID